LKSFTSLALSIEENAKGKALLIALERGFAEADRLGAARKAIIFTESRRTQNYLLRVLAGSPFAEGIVLFNGSNTDERSRAIYTGWLQRHAGSDRVTGSRTADMRSALVDYFRDEGQIMIATEAGAEGINLQFCSLVVNYDLPWNPQRIEQRIGRCHRYGQKHDVVVVNFLNQTNAADQRVFELLSEKFQLFEGVFGASDEVLGAIESGVDFEKRIAAIYQQCRLPHEIEAAFSALRQELETEIDEAITQTRQQLLDNFDDEVREKLRVTDADSREYLNRSERMLMELTQYELGDHAQFSSDSAFDLRDNPFPVAVPLGRYELPRRSGDAHFYRLNHPLAEAVLTRAKVHHVPPALVTFDYAAYPGKISALDPLIGATGWLAISELRVEGMEFGEDHLILAAMTENGACIDAETAARFFSLPARIEGTIDGGGTPALLEQIAADQSARVTDAIASRNAVYFEQEMGKLDAWADDRRVSLRRQVKDLDAEIAALRKQSRQAGTMPEKLSLQRKVNQTETRRDEAESDFRAASREVERRKNELLDDIERRLSQETAVVPLFTIRWRLV
jgi:adenine-specific DNA-methyltransferase